MARVLQMSGMRSFVILEANSEPGGLCRTKIVDGHTLDIGGGHFLGTKFKEVYDFVFSKPNGIYTETNVKRWRRSDELFAHQNDYAYPVPAIDWARTIDIVMREAEEAGVLALGR